MNNPLKYNLSFTRSEVRKTPRTENGSSIVNVALYVAIALFFAKFVFRIIPDPVDESTLFAASVGGIFALSTILLSWFKHDLSRLETTVDAIRNDISSIKIDIAVMKKERQS